MRESFYKDEWITQYCSDALKVLPELESDSVDLLATDPPYGISFMGKDWDKALPDIEIWRECLRVLKAGSFAFVMSIPRADCLSRMIISLEDAGFLVNFTPIFWAYASGFPKAQNIGKAVDKRLGSRSVRNPQFNAVRNWLKELVKSKGLTYRDIDTALGNPNSHKASHYLDNSQPQVPTLQDWNILKVLLDVDSPINRPKQNETFILFEREVIGQKIKARAEGQKSALPTLGASTQYITIDETIPYSPQAKALDGSYGGFQPKPAVEVIIVAMKPLSEKTFVAQALKNRKGITWLDDCRIPTNPEVDDMLRNVNRQKRETQTWEEGSGFKNENNPLTGVRAEGRFPANLLVSDDVLNDGKISKSTGGHGEASRNWQGDGHTISMIPQATGGFGDSGSFSRYFDLDKWWAKTFPFFIVPKASKGEKNKGLDGLPLRKPSQEYNLGAMEGNPRKPAKCTGLEKVSNNHPTVKPLKLMSYLVSLGSRAGDIVLDPFAGSGTTMIASKLLNRKCIGIEIKEKYCEIAVNRCLQSVLDLSV